MTIQQTGANYVLKDSRGHTIATVWGIRTASGRKALKMAAADELLEALRDAVHYEKSRGGVWPVWVHTAETAIAAATGDA